MPVSRWALVEAHLSGITNVTKGHLYKHVPMTAHTSLRALGDIIPVGVVRTVVSIGDVAMLVGIAITVALATRIPRRHEILHGRVETTAHASPVDRQLPVARELAKGT
jgi:hypothetical protein